MNDRINALGASTLAALLVVALLVTAGLTGCGSDSGSISPPATPTVAVGDSGTPNPEATSSPLLMVFDMPDSRTLAYSPDGTQIAIGSGNTIWLYTAELEQVRALKGHTKPVRSVAWSPDGTQIASGALDNTVRVWDVDSGSAVHTLSGHTNWVLSVAWSPDGSTIASGGADDSVRLWDAEDGDPLTVLGVTRVDSVTFQFQDQTILDTLRELAYASEIVAAVEAEPYRLVQQTLDDSYTITITFDDQDFVDTLLALDHDPPHIEITVDDGELSETLAALDQEQIITLITMLNDPEVAAAIDELEAAEATITAINERPDADLLRTIRQLQRQEFMIVIEQTGGEATTISPGDEDFIATIQDLAGQDVTLSVELQNQQAILDALQDPEFVAALNQLDEASAIVSAFNERPDADMIRLVRQLQPLDYAITFNTGDEAFDAALAALDQPARFHLFHALQDDALLTTLTRLDEASYTITDIDRHNTGAITQAIDAAPADLAYSLALQVDDSALAEAIAALEPADLRHVIDLLEDPIFRYKLGHYADALDTIETINARDDVALITLIQGLGSAKTFEVIFSSPQGSDEVRVTRKLAVEDLIITVTPDTEDAILDLSALDDDAIADRFRAMSAADLAERPYTITPELDSAALEMIMPQLADIFTVSVQRENNAHIAGVTAVMWSPDSATLASASSDNTVKVWDPASGQILATFEAHDDSITTAAWAPSAPVFATASWDNSVILWDTSAGADSIDEAGTLKGFDKRVNVLAWSPDAATLATGMRDGVITVWDADTGDELGTAQHLPEVVALAWSPDGTRLISSGDDGAVRLWDAAAMVGSSE